jgi:hypothetical protein
MTIIEMHELCDLLIDKANAPWFTAEEKDLFINLAQIEYLDKKYKFFEVNEEIREKLLPLVRSTTITGPTNQINLSDVANFPEFRYILSVRGDFPDGCGGEGTVTCAIKPDQLDDEVGNSKDPFNKADNFFPLYTQENDGTDNLVKIISDDNPSNIIVKYLKTPTPVLNDLDTPANNIDSQLAQSSHEEIVHLAVKKMLGNIQDQFGYQVQDLETKK